MEQQEMINIPLGQKIERGSIRELTNEEKNKYRERAYRWVVITPYKYSPKDLTKTITVPENFLTDGATGAQDDGISWIFHDWLYSTHKYDDGSECTREEADSIMAEILDFEERWCFHSIFSCLSVYNCCYKFSNAWEESGNIGPEFL
jgi:hypothetical protein